MLRTRIGWLLFGLMFILIGFLTYAHKGWHFTRFGPTHHTAGYIFLIGGLIISLFALLKKNFPREQPDDCMICVSCLKPIYRNELEDEKCPFCNGEAEKIKGFYDRHPELKSEE